MIRLAADVRFAPILAVAGSKRYHGRNGPVAEIHRISSILKMPKLRTSLCAPIPEIFGAARRLLEALQYHREGNARRAEELLREADDKRIWAYTDQAWGKGSAARYGFVAIDGAPRHYAAAERPVPRMPVSASRRAIIARDGYHCRFCGIPVIDPTIRGLVKSKYPGAVSWGPTNATQHAAFQCMWLQYDHVLPSARGGDSSIDNIVITCAPCNFGRMNATIEEARLLHPLEHSTPNIWDLHDQWDGLERFRADL